MEVQLEFNFEKKTPEEMTLQMMQKQLDQVCVTTDKVRKRMFAELGEVKKLCAKLQKENEDLKSKMTEINHGKTEWTYGQNGLLFDVRKYQQAAG